MSSPWIYLVALLIGAAGGGVSGLLGVGGAAVISPLLQFALGVGQHEAQGISLAVILPPVGIPALLAYRRKGIRINVPLVLCLIGAFAGAGYLGGRSAVVLPEQTLRRLFSAFLALVAIRTLHSARTAAPAIDAAAGSQSIADTETSALSIHAHKASKQRILLVGLVTGFMAGFCSGLLGVGGGIVVVPLLQHWLKLTRLEAQASSLAMMLPPIGLPAVLVYAHSTHFHFDLVLALVLGFVSGSYSGARLSTEMKPQGAARTFALLLFCIAGFMLLR